MTLTESQTPPTAETTPPFTPSLKARAGQVGGLAELALLVPVGVGLTFRDDLIDTVKTFTTKETRDRQLKRYEKRGAKARKRLMKQVKRRRNALRTDAAQLRTELGKRREVVSEKVEVVFTTAQALIG